MKTQTAKNWKMEPGLALLNSLYGTLGQPAVFGNLRGGPHGRRREVVTDTPLKAQKAAKSRRIPPSRPKRTQTAKGHLSSRPEVANGTPQRPKWRLRSENEGAEGQNERK